LAGRLKPLPALFPEEERSRQPSVFSILRTLIQEFSVLAIPASVIGPSAMTFCSSSSHQKRCRATATRSPSLPLRDIYFMDRKKEQIERCQYDSRTAR